MHRAYAKFEIKESAVAKGKRLFSGIATTPTPDRTNDIVEPTGAKFQLPLALLWQHNAREPIGWIHSAAVSEAGISVEGEVANLDVPGKLKDRLDEAWQSLAIKLVRGFSIGFRPLESARIGDTYSYRYLSWEWLELSAVTIPMNADCTIDQIKAADQLVLRAAPGAMQAGRVVRLDGGDPSAQQLPGASGEPASRRKGVVYLGPR